MFHFLIDISENFPQYITNIKGFNMYDWLIVNDGRILKQCKSKHAAKVNLTHGGELIYGKNSVVMSREEFKAKHPHE